MSDIIQDAWYSCLPGTRAEFLVFLGVDEAEIQAGNWDSFSKIGHERFGLIPLGGGMKYAGTELEQFTFKMRPSRKKRFWRAGIPAPGAWIDEARDGYVGFIGSGKTLDVAALSALMVLWELTYLRASQEIMTV